MFSGFKIAFQKIVRMPGHLERSKYRKNRTGFPGTKK